MFAYTIEINKTPRISKKLRRFRYIPLLGVVVPVDPLLDIDTGQLRHVGRAHQVVHLGIKHRTYREGPTVELIWNTDVLQIHVDLLMVGHGD